MTRPLEWMTAIRDHPARPPAAQRHVLAMLALRLHWKTGEGAASAAQLAADADCCERTVRNATGWARGEAVKLLEQTRRGHRLGNGEVRASEWRLCPPSTCQPRAVEKASTGKSEPSQPANRSRLNRHAPAPPSRPRPSRPSPSSPARTPERDQREHLDGQRATGTETDGDIAEVKTRTKTEPADYRHDTAALAARLAEIRDSLNSERTRNAEPTLIRHDLKPEEGTP